ncbi:hypothetical protein IW150_007328, partial [Coemansia sp. RSA 2607]
IVEAEENDATVVQSAPVSETNISKDTGASSVALSPLTFEPHSVEAPLETDNTAEHNAPVVVGTIEAVKTEVADRSATTPEAADKAYIEPSAAVTSSNTAAEPDVPLQDITHDTQAAQEASSWGSPLSQMSYNRADSQLSRPGVDMDSSVPAETDTEKIISDRDSAIFMDKPFAETAAASAPLEQDTKVGEVQTPREAYSAPSEDKQGAQTPYSTFSTPAFPEYFNHSGAHQQGSEVVDRREIPRASEGGARQPVSTRPKDVLMELNIETPHDGRQVLQLRGADNIDERCEEFCTSFNMIELLPGMRTLVRGKVERRLARRRERALQLAAAAAVAGDTSV